MEHKNIKRNEPVAATVPQRMVDLYILSVLVVFPLFATDAYYNILESKYYYYVASVVILALLLLGTALFQFQNVKAYFAKFKWKDFLKRCSVSDFALCIFLLVAALSTITSDYVFESFWGNEGRFSGLFLLSLYGISYFLLSRFGRFKRWYLDVFLISGAVMCLLGIGDYFRLDLIGFKLYMKPEQKDMFTSTIGNINTYTAIVAMLAALSSVLFAIEQKSIKKKLFYMVSLAINLFALIMGVSDNAYLSLAALFGLLPLYLFQNRHGIKQYVIILATFFSVIKAIDWINTIAYDKVVGIESVFNLVANFSGLLLIVILLWGVVLFLHVFKFDSQKDPFTPLTFPRYIWMGVLVLGILAIGYMLFDVNVLGNSQRYGSLTGYLLLNDDWGTHRGYIWRNAMECFQKFSPWKKLVGFGPDTFGIIMLNKTSGNIYKEFFDNAHNEYLHYLITVGVAGLAAYVVFLFSLCTRMLRFQKRQVWILAIFIAIACYLTQAFVNLNLPIATPVLWTLLSLGGMICREEEAAEKAAEKVIP